MKAALSLAKASLLVSFLAAFLPNAVCHPGVTEIAAMTEQKTTAQKTDSLQPRTSPSREKGRLSRDDDDEPMVHEIPQDYAGWARQERERLLAEGADPDTVVLQSEMCNHAPRIANESVEDFARRYVNTMNSMIDRGVSILNDVTTADVQASGFGTPDGRFFDLGPGTGMTKGEFREFSEWWETTWETRGVFEVPEKWLKYERPAEVADEL